MEYTLTINIPDAASQFLDPRISRAFFVANNSETECTIFQTLDLQSTDIIVQFNKPRFFNALAPFRSHKLHVLNRNNLNSCWGFSEDGTPEIDYVAQECTALTFAIAGEMPSCLKPYRDKSSEKATWMSQPLNSYILPYHFPKGTLPSVGFASVAYFRFLNWLRHSMQLDEMELYLIGFTGIYRSGRAWSGHDFAFEQTVYSTWLEIFRLGNGGTPNELCTSWTEGTTNSRSRRPPRNWNKRITS